MRINFEIKTYLLCYFILTLALVYTSYNLLTGQSSLSLASLRNYLTDEVITIAIFSTLMLLSVFFVFTCKYLILINLTYASYCLFVYSGKKYTFLLVAIILFFIIISYFIYQLVSIEENETYFSEGLTLDQLHDTFSSVLLCEVKKGKKIFQGKISNWSHNGCFIYLDDKVKLRGNVVISVFYEGQRYTDKGKIVKSNNNNGYGIKVKQNTTLFSWNSLMNILYERRMRVENLT